MVYSMASILHYSGDTSAGAWVRNRAKRYINDPLAYTTFFGDLRHHVKLMKYGTRLGKSFNILSSVLTGIYLVQIQGSDGKDDHCVTVSNEWIFDSNFKNALPRTQTSLDMCCSSDDVKCHFLSSVKVEHFPRITII